MKRGIEMEYLSRIWQRYRKSERSEKGKILDEFCNICKYNRKYAMELLRKPLRMEESAVRKKEYEYSWRTISILEAIWEASGYMWSRRLKSALPLWLPWAKRHFQITEEVEEQLLSISAATIDRRLSTKKWKLKRRIYGRTRPGSLLKHQIPIRTDCWDIKSPGFLEVDLVSHSGASASGEFIYTLDCVDIDTTWSERRAVMGRGQRMTLKAFEEIEGDIPFRLRGIDSDNDDAFINYHLIEFWRERGVQPTRSRPYKKDDNAHIEQKNWTHVRQIFGYDRYDTEEALLAMNDLYCNELKWFQNFFQPSVKLIKKIRIGSKLKRVYDTPKTPLERVCSSKGYDKVKVAKLKILFQSLDPFELSEKIEEKLEKIYRLAKVVRLPMGRSSETENRRLAG